MANWIYNCTEQLPKCFPTCHQKENRFKKQCLATELKANLNGGQCKQTKITPYFEQKCHSTVEQDKEHT